MPSFWASFELFLILISSFLIFFLDLIKFENLPVCISTQSVPISLEIIISLSDGLIKRLVLIFFFLNN